LKTVSFFALSAHFPDYALGAGLAVGAEVGAGLAVLKAFLAIADRHLLALDIGLTARVISTFHDSYIIHLSDFPGKKANLRLVLLHRFGGSATLTLCT